MRGGLPGIASARFCVSVSVSFCGSLCRPVAMLDATCRPGVGDAKLHTFFVLFNNKNQEYFVWLDDCVLPWREFDVSLQI